MRIAPLAAALGLTLTLCATGLSASDPPEPTKHAVPAKTRKAAPKTHTVTMAGMRFDPNELTVAPGDTIVWVNEDLLPHTATSESGGFDSKNIEPGESWKYTVSKKGDFAYACTFHPKMTAILHVK